MSTGPKHSAARDQSEPASDGTRPRPRKLVDADLERYIADVVTADLDLNDPKLAWIRERREKEDKESTATRLIPETDDLALEPQSDDGDSEPEVSFPDTPSLAEGGGLWARTADLRPIVERRRNERYEFDNFTVRATLKDAQGTVSRGLVRDMSCGGLFVESPAPFRFKSDVYLEVALQQGRSLTVAGRVVYQPESGMAIRLRTDVQTRAFLLAFIDEITEPSADDALREVTIIQREAPANPSALQELDVAALSQAWNRVLRHQEDDDVHQAFIQKCLKAQRLDFALEKYRGLQNERAEDDRVTQYLTQVGTILNFQAFSRDDRNEAAKSGTSWAMKLMFIFFGGVFVLWIILLFLR